MSWKSERIVIHNDCIVLELTKLTAQRFYSVPTV